jgi:hypothetical protein
MRRSMQQPALRLALLTFATILVSGCAEQFATHLAHSNWGTTAQMPLRKSQQSASDAGGKVTARFVWNDKKKRSGTWHFAKVMPHCLQDAGWAAAPQRRDIFASAGLYGLLVSRTGDGRVVRTSDYCREHVG